MEDRLTRLAPIILGCLACSGCAGRATEAPAGVAFAIESGFGDESGWVGEHLEASSAVLVRMMDSPDVAPPRRIDVTLVKDPEAEWLAGWAGPSAIGFSSDQWPKEAQRLWILTHELTNLFAAHYAGHGGFPSDWWSNGRSPFPAYVAVLVLSELGHVDESAWLRSTAAGEPDHELYWALHERFGFALFARTLRLLRQDDLDLGEIEPPWPHASRVRSAYAIAYLSAAAGENLASTVSSFGIGRRPADWSDIHPEIPFEEYSVGESEVEGILRARESVCAKSGSAEARALFREGRWREALERATPSVPAACPPPARDP